MTNKTFKEEIEQKFDERFGTPIYKDEFYQGSKGQTAGCDDCEGSSEYRTSMKLFMKESLDLYKQKILEALPKGEQTLDTDPGLVVTVKITRNSGLSEVKQIIENI